MGGDATLYSETDTLGDRLDLAALRASAPDLLHGDAGALAHMGMQDHEMEMFESMAHEGYGMGHDDGMVGDPHMHEQIMRDRAYMEERYLEQEQRERMMYEEQMMGMHDDGGRSHYDDGYGDPAGMYGAPEQHGMYGSDEYGRGGGY